MRFPSYDSYKETGTKWLGSIPTHWSTKPTCAMYRRDKRTGYADEQLLSVYRDYGVIPKSSRDDNFNKPSEDLSGYQLVEPRDLAMNKMKAWQGSVAVSEHRGIVSPAYFVFKALHHEHDRYIHYLLRSSRYIAGYLSLSKGIRVNQWDLDPNYHAQMPVVLPSFKEQQAIATFLDHETARIYILIEKQQELIALLKEKRQAVISHAVTKGLDSTAPMKQSGVKWLGDVPAHWEVTKLGFNGSTQNGISKGGEYFGTGYPFVSYGDVYNNESLPSEVHGLVQSTASERHTCSVKGSDVFFTRTSETLEEIGFTSTCFKSIPNATFAGFLIRFRPRDELLFPGYSQYFFRCELHRAYFVKEMNLVTRASLSQGLLKKLPVLIPPFDEQKMIAESLDQKSKKFSDLIQRALSAIELLQERRTALISAAVTGKIDVRNHPSAREAA